MSVLHVIYDPLCGWCYAAEPLLQAVADAWPELPRQWHAGGLFTATRLPAAKRAMIRQADARIGQLTGQVFGAPYLEGLLADEQTVYDSLPPITAILAAQHLRADRTWAMLQAIQHAHYVQGRRVVEPAVLADLAATLGLDPAAFATAFQALAGDATARHIQQTRQLMRQVGAQGFPALVLQQGERWQRLPHEQHYGSPAGFTASLAATLAG